MIIKKGTLVKVLHSRKGMFEAKAIKDFDTEKEEFYPLQTRQNVDGLVQDWGPGDRIPCRASKCVIEVIR